MIGTSQIQNMFFESLSIYSDRNQAAQTNITNGVAGYDAHEDGNAYNLICMSFLFRALSACTHELISSLKRASLWNRSMIHISAEFTRSARSAVNPTDNMGSDHGWSGNTHTLLSGKFDRFASVGNIARGDAGGGYAGTWGSVALTNVDGTSIHPLLGNVASTIAKVMGVETPTPNDPPLGVIQNGQLLLRAEKTKLVA
jgi:hypothetical protein